jgi:N-acetylglucosamine-6-phosphate deacetylase
MRKLAGNILTPQGFVNGTLTMAEDGRISSISGQSVDTKTVRDAGLPIILPGFVDLHVHGGGGCDVMDGGESCRKIARTHVQYGTTTLLATTMTAPYSDLHRAFTDMAAVVGKREANAARVLGVHLEGPYINPGKLGAQPDFARPVEPDELAQLHALAAIKLITMAPEVPGNNARIAALVAAGFKVQIGHSSGTYEEGVAALAEGADGFTHLFNAMTGLHHRKPGMVGCALAHAHFAEIIPDLLHVHPGAIHVALRAIPHLFCVTDSTAATGMPDGDYMLGRSKVTKCLGGVRLADGTLAGSTLTMDQALRNLVDTIGLTLIDASKRVSTYAADYIGAHDRGRLSVGTFADVLVLDQDLQLVDIYTEGVPLEHAN